MIYIKFKYRPSETDRETLSLNGFRYDKHTRTWSGEDTEYNRLLAHTMEGKTWHS